MALLAAKYGEGAILCINPEDAVEVADYQEILGDDEDHDMEGQIETFEQAIERGGPLIQDADAVGGTPTVSGEAYAGIAGHAGRGGRSSGATATNRTFSSSCGHRPW